MAETEYLEVAGRTMDLLVEAPAGPGPHPAVLLMYHRGGFDDCTAHYVRTLSAAGYLTVVPNFYHHCPKDVPQHDCKQFLRDDEVIAEIEASAAFVAGRPDVDRKRYFIMGHCMGGRLAFLGASVTHVFTAAIAYYGGGMMIGWGEAKRTPFDRIGDIRCPVYGFFGDLDTNPSPADVDRIEAALERHGIAHEFHRYPGADHGFQNPARADPRSAEERRVADVAWARTMDLMAGATVVA